MTYRPFAIPASRGSPVAAALTTAWRFRLLFLLVCIGTGIVSVLMGPDNYWDLRYYHLYAPWAYLHHRYLYDVGPAQEQGFLNPTADFLFYGMIMSPLNAAPRLIAFIMGTLHGLNAAFGLAIACFVITPPEPRERITLRAVAWLMGVTGAGFVGLIGTASNDLITSLFVLGSLYGLLKATYPLDTRRTWQAFAWPGLLGGLGVGLKFTSAVFVPGLALAAVVVAVMRRSKGALFIYAGAATLGFLVVAGHHMLVLWLDFGNPTFPYLNQIFHSPWWEPIAVRDDRFIPQTFWHFLIFPFTWTVLDDYIVSEPFLRDWRFAITYVAGIVGLVTLAVRYLRARFGAPQLAKPDSVVGALRGQVSERTRGLAIVCAFVVPSYVAWVLGFGYYRYAVPLEMLTGVVTVGVLIWLFDDRRLRIGAAVATLAIAMVTTYYLNWGRGQYGDRYVDVRVPPLPEDAIVLIATWDPVAFFIPYAEPRAQYLGIENNYLEIAQHNLLTEKVNRIMRTPGRPKFVLNVDAFNADKLNALLAHYDLKLGDAPCRPIETNLSGHSLSLCAVADG